MMKKKRKPLPLPSWKSFFFSGIPVAERYSWLKLPLPERAALHRYYDWQEGDVPPADETVQWLLLFEYVAFTTTGNRFLQTLFMSAPPKIRQPLLPLALRRFYPDIDWSTTKISGDEEDSCRLLPCRHHLIPFGGALFPTGAVPFMTDSSVAWPTQSTSGTFLLPFDAVKGSVFYLPPDLLHQPSLRCAVGGSVPQIGPTIIIRNKKRRSDLPSPEAAHMLQRSITGATFLEPFAPLRTPSHYIPPASVDPTFVEMMAGTGTPVPGLQEMPLVKLPGHNENAFLVSGMTQGILGRGGMGMVYKILIRELEVFHALKILQPAGCTTEQVEWEQFCRRFLREAKILANLHHTHIVRIHGFGEWQNYPYIEMEYVDGADIKSMLATSPQIAAPATTGIAIQVARALSHAHNKRYILDGKERRGLIHRDLKPQNIMVSGEGESKLLDFGVAMPIASLTQTATSSSFVGTLQYASPEQVMGQDLDLRTDIHSFGQVMFEMLTGKTAFPASSIQQIIQMKLNNTWDAAALSRLPLPRPLVHIVKTCMHRDPDRRFRSSEDLLSVLEEAHQKLTSENPDAVVRDYVKDRSTVLQPERRKSFAGGKRLLSWLGIGR